MLPLPLASIHIGLKTTETVKTVNFAIRAHLKHTAVTSNLKITDHNTTANKNAKLQKQKGTCTSEIVSQTEKERERERDMKR